MRRLRLGRLWTLAIAAACATAAVPVAREAQTGDGIRRFQVSGMVVQADPRRDRIVIAHDAVAGLMAAMTMPFAVLRTEELSGLTAGSFIDFTLVVTREASYVEAIVVRPYQGVEQDPLNARRLALLSQLTAGRVARTLSVGDEVPDFALIDQDAQRVTLSAFRGKVVGINVMYTTCQLPDFCLRIVNHFAVIQRRLAARMGRDLVLLTITFDPARDTPAVLKAHAAQWKPDFRSWRFLTGPTEAIRDVTGGFGIGVFPNDGLMDHTLRTVLIDRRGRVAASLEGNQYSTDQLTSLTTHILDRP